ncbi:glycosyltransferase [Hoeflea poritis]|uniref:Glycosyltransferase n=1 Tax=Hoeflea poritis TaxID=2993659 RepID=A0ABT4VM18_9HYPH|nr:glycosyltransferase [Hoeflea poritis]MDA4845205.1 glycosyltransferase [Hoeflea poritis]
MSDLMFDDLQIAVLLPCYNEEATIGDVVAGFRRELPNAHVFVYDNNSSDRTAILAARAGATVVREPRQGKGHVVRRMFADIDADIYVMADGDGTYAPEDAPDLVRTLVTERSDMVVGTRRGVTADAGRSGHAFGNRLFNFIYTALFGRDFTDIFSGYRVFNRRFAKSFPALSGGFEIETEMSVHASMLRMPVSELTLDYGRRPEGSDSKLSTFKDGFKILWMLMLLVKETRPFLFFSSISGAMLIASLAFMAPVLAEYFETGLVSRLPTWIAAIALLMISMLFFVAGVILDSLARSRAEHKRMLYMGLPTTRGEPRAVGVDQRPSGGKARKSIAA